MPNARLATPAMLPPGWIAPTATAVAFLLSALLGLAISKGTGGIAAFWPSNGILLSALLLCSPERRWRHVALCIPASFAANFWGGAPWELAALFTVANVLTAVLAAGILQGLRAGADAFDTVGGAGRFLVAIGVAAPVGAWIASIGIAYAGGSFLAAWISWVTSDLLGMLLISSLILTLAGETKRKHHGSAMRRLGALVWPIVLVNIASVIVFSSSGLPLLFVPLTVVLIATYRSGLSGAVLGTVSVAIVATLFTEADRGPITLIAGPTLFRVEFLQLYIAVLFGTCLPLAALLSERSRLAEERADSERRHRRILERSREVIFETDLTGRWTYLSAAWTDLVGIAPQDSLGRSFLNTIAPDERSAALDRLKALYDRQIEACQQELRFVRADGDVRWASVRSHLLLDDQGAAVGTYGTIHDATDRRRADDARQASERLYKLLADNSNDMIVRLSLQGVRRYVSPASITVLGYTPQELLGQAAAGAIHADDRAMAIATCQSLLEGADHPICVYRQLHKNGSYVWLEASYRLIRDTLGDPVELIATVRDVGRREQAELERLTSNARLSEANRLLLLAEEMSRIGHWRVDVTKETVYWSDVVCAMHNQPAGYAPTLMQAIECYHPDDRPAVQDHVSQAMALGTAFAFDARIVRSDGALRQIICRGRTEIGPDGSVIGVFGVVQDVTEAHQADAALQGVTRRLRDKNHLLKMAETVGKIGHWRIDFRDDSMLWSDEVYRIYDLSRDVVPTAENALRVYHPDDVAAVRETFANARKNHVGYSSQARIIIGDGSIVHINTRGEVEVDAEGMVIGFFGIVQDITERMQAEAQLQESEARFRLLTEQASDMISLHDVNGTCLFVSPSVRKILGYEPQEFLSRGLSSLVAQEDQAIVDQLRSDLKLRKSGEVSVMRFRMVRPDGALVWIEAAARIADYQREARIIVVSRDVSDQVRAEGELEAARVQAEDAVRAKSSFLANMSHEIRTPMNGVIGFTELLLDSSLTHEQRRQAEMIADSGRAMMRLLNDILDLSKVEAGQMIIAAEPFDLCHTLRACMKLVTPTLEKKGLAPYCNFSDDLPKIVSGDGLRLRQILLNLLGNAAKFTAEGSVTLRASPIAGGNDVLIEVIDTGIGIPKDRHASIFEQFVQADGTIARRYGGTGLGLAISTQLADLMGGTLNLESEPGRGTTFALLLPLAAVASAQGPARVELMKPATPEPTADPGQPSTAVRVLVAEDHDVNRLLMSAMLGKLGYACELAEDGAEAIAMVADAERAGRPYAVVLMDMQMPHVDGLEATRQLRKSGLGSTKLPIVALTANAYADDVTACLAAGMQAHLAKPVALADLATALRRWAVVPVMPVTPVSGVLKVAPTFKPAIQQRYQVRRTEALDALSAMVRTGRFDDAEVTQVAEMLHKLAGTAAMFGEATLGDEARRLEEGLHDWPAADRLGKVAQSFEAITRAAAG